MKNHLRSLVILCCLSVVSAHADLLGVNPGDPRVNYVGQSSSALAYDAVTHEFVVDADPTGIEFSPDEGGIIIGGARALHLDFRVDNFGVFESGTNGFILTGEFTRVVGGVTNVYSGTLLQGDVIAFGSFESGATDQYDFRVHLTGGQLLSFFSCGDLAINLTSENSTFTGSFAQSFVGACKGFFGPEDLLPPTIVCPAPTNIQFQAVTNNGVPGFIVTFPDPVVSDNCDPAPLIFCEIPSGSFLPVNLGDVVTLTCYAIDAAGNFSSCSVTVVVTVPDAGGTPIKFTDGPCTPTTLCNDPTKCSATYVFAPPVATNGSGQTFVATASAVDQDGAVIALTVQTNGLISGKFPRTTTGTNVITFIADDGQGNTAQRQCSVLVNDCEPPSLLCVDQAGTFKPIFTNAESCINAEFSADGISSNSIIWFSSVLHSPSDNRGLFTVHAFEQTIELLVDETNLTIQVPDAYVTVSNGVVTSTTTFAGGHWTTMVKPNLPGNTFLCGVAFDVPFDFPGCAAPNCDNGRCGGGFRSRSQSHVTATWCARFEVSRPDVLVQWQWAAAVYTNFSTSYSSLGVKPVDANTSNPYNNLDNAGTPEAFKQFSTVGARGDGSWSKPIARDQYTGHLTPPKKANLGLGTVCLGPVNFETPLAADNCDDQVTVVCTPPSGSIFGLGDHVISCVATDRSGNSNQCSFTLTVLPPLQVVFDSPSCDNVNDNIVQPDAGFRDMNCPDDPSATQIVNRFSVGDKICHTVRLIDCDGQDVTSAMASLVTVHIDVSERQGAYSSSVLVNNLPLTSSGIGSPGSIMVPSNGRFQFTVDTSGFERGTANDSRFFRTCVWVDYNSSPGVAVGMEDVLLESQ